MMKIKVQENGPYLVTGNVPISEWIIVPNGGGYVFKEGRKFPRMESYSLCRCGMSDIPPFCDGSHIVYDFRGEETASRMEYLKRADMLNGPRMRLLDDNRCAFARFCHREGGSVWELTLRSDNEHDRSEAIIAASECPAGRLVAVEENGHMIEPDLEPGIEIIQDPQKGCSSGIYVKGGILVEGCDGYQYEVRNRVMLCRCGKSRNKPFCDASHVGSGFHDGYDEQAHK